MPNKKIKEESLIHIEVERLNNKIAQFQRYLDDNPIERTVDIKDLEIELQDKIHKEIIIQMKVVDALFVWLPALAKLRETEEEKGIETRGDVKLPGMYKNR